jgi:hypothetical protein
MNIRLAPKSAFHQHQESPDKTGQSEKPAIIVDQHYAAHAEYYSSTNT